jgi:twitching motility two-component system response regulator PilG
MSGLSAVLRDGILAAQARDFERARGLLEQATTETPGDPVAWFWLAIASPTASAALPCLRRVLEIDPAHEQARSALTRLLQSEANRLAAAGARAEGCALALEATQVAPAAQATWLTLAALTDDHAGRIDALRKALEMSPDDVQLRTRLRQALLARGVMRATERGEACACFREAAALGADDVRAWRALAKLTESPAEAVDALQHVRRLAPDDRGVVTELRNALAAHARQLTDAQHHDDAYRRWQEAIELAGGDVETWLGVAETTSDQKEAARAVESAFACDSTDERAIAAMRRLNASKIDPAKVAAPVDAFARFEPDAGGEVLVDLDVSLDADLESSLDALVQSGVAPAPVQRPAAVPPAAKPAPAAAAPPAAEAPKPLPAETPKPAAQARPLIEMPEVELDLSEPPAAPAPAAVAAAAPAAPAPAAAAPAADGNGSRHRTVMIVDDSPTIRKILGLTLERAGYKVVAEPDGESAIERLVHFVPDLILLDIAMPKLDGYEVCKRIRQDPRTASVPVVMLSGKGAMFDKVKGHRAGATEYLTKPFETPAVLAVVTNYCEQAGEAALHG